MEGIVKSSPAELAYASSYRDSHRGEICELNAAYKEANKDVIRDSFKRRQSWFAWNLNILKRAQGCRDCSTHEGSLLHHHKDPGTKKYSVSQMCNNSLEKFIDEIAKCTVLCYHCHRVHHESLIVERRC